jgi:hypothetical protein
MGFVLRERGFDDGKRRVRWKRSTGRGNRILVTAAAFPSIGIRVGKCTEQWSGKSKPIHCPRIFIRFSCEIPRTMRQKKRKCGKYRGVSDKRSALSTRRPQRFVELKQMNRRAVCRRRLEMRRDKKLAQILANPVQPGISRREFLSGIAAGKRTQKWLAHAQASVSAPRFGPTTSGGGHQSASQKSLNRVWLPTKEKMRFEKNEWENGR